VEIDVICDKEPKTIRFHDARLFGNMKFYRARGIEEIPGLAKLGPEALNTVNVDFTIDKSKREWNVLDAAMMLRPNHEIKHALMDQEAVAGIGNIYSTEACFMAGVNPFRLCKNLSTDEWQRIFERSQQVLRDALARKLDYSQLMAYRQKDCVVCEGKIQRKELRGRSTFWCPSCQK
jgi:formamidopyrimidine-DNA glycosylase